MSKRVNMTACFDGDGSNIIEMVWDEKNDYLISEIRIGRLGSYRRSVISIDDLTRALKTVGYTLTADREE